jgi:hypothetical protein
MKNYSKISLLALILCLFQFSTYCLNHDVIVSAGSLINDRTIKDLNSFQVRVSSFLTGNGTISVSNYVDIKSAYFEYRGIVSAGQSCNIKTNIFEENALIESPNINISCDEFNFSGTISCDKKCIIYAKKAFDTNMFKRSGNGTFKVVISPYDVRYWTQEDLSSAYYDYFCSNCLNLKENAIDNIIKDMRIDAVLNFIDDKVVLEDIKKNLGAEVDFHKARLKEKQDMGFLYCGLAKCGVTAVGLGIAYALFEKEQYLTAKIEAGPEFIKLLSAMLAGASALYAGFSFYDFYNWSNQRHQEKHDGFALIISRIEHALTIPEFKSQVQPWVVKKIS